MNCNNCTRRPRTSAETDHSPEWVLSRELARANKRLCILLTASVVAWAGTVLYLFFAH